MVASLALAAAAAQSAIKGDIETLEEGNLQLEGSCRRQVRIFQRGKENVFLFGSLCVGAQWAEKKSDSIVAKMEILLRFSNSCFFFPVKDFFSFHVDKEQHGAV